MTHPTVTARGHAVVSVPPDASKWTLELSRLAETTHAALDDVARRSQELGLVLGELGVPEEGRSTSAVSLAEEFDYVEGRQVHRGFRATLGLTVRLADPQVAASLVQRAVGELGAAVSGPRWQVDADNPGRRRACRLAALEARTKADAYAEALGLRVTEVTKIRDAEVGPQQPGPVPMRAVAADVPLEVSPGQVQVSATVDVTLRLVLAAET